MQQRGFKDAGGKADRQAVNTACQGSAADVVKYAMVKLDRRIAAELPPNTARMVL